jgi:hypothetical protein
MKQQLQEFLSENLSHPPVETLIAGTRQVEIIKPISWKGIDYAGPDSRLVHGTGQFLTLPVAEVKELYSKRAIRIINPEGRRNAGTWDAYEVELPNQRLLRGYRPWSLVDFESRDQSINRLEKTEYDHVFVPVIERRRSSSFGFIWSPLFLLEYQLVQRCVLRGSPDWEQQSLIIDLNAVAKVPARRSMAVSV